MTKFADTDFFRQQHTLGDCIRHEKEQFRLHQATRLADYLKQRQVFLAKQKNGNLSSDFLAQYKPSIGVFAGSFNPFHKGHFNVLQKAEKIFDKVIIAFGKNTEKGQRTWPIPSSIKNRQIEEYSGLLTDFVQSLGHDAVIIRGLRNSTDFQYEQNQYRYIQELMPGIKIINIFCDKEFEHISSSGIRTLEKFGRHQNYLLE
jgi:pantetheine-phosphate adenylyltransferase